MNKSLVIDGLKITEKAELLSHILVIKTYIIKPFVTN